MRARGPTVVAICLVLSLVASALPVGGQGPLPDLGDAGDWPGVVAADAADSVDAAEAYADDVQARTHQALATLSSPAFPLAAVTGLLDDSERFAVRVIENAQHSTVAGIEAVADGRAGVAAYGGYLQDVTLHALGVRDSPAFPFIEVGSYGPCVHDVQAALDAAHPGDHVIACAGVHGPLVVRTEFITLRSEQGAGATVVDGQGGTAIDIQATGVRVSGFTVQGADGAGAAGIRVGAQGDLVDRALAGVVIRDNIVRGNTVGIDLYRVIGVLVAENTIERSTDRNDVLGGIGLRLVVRTDTEDSSTSRLAVVAAANNFLSNEGFAIGIAGGPPRPVLAVANHFGSALPPAMEVAGLCADAAGLPGSAPCANGIATGVVLVGWSPRAW